MSTGSPTRATRPGTALITGAGGQDGMLLARRLRSQGWAVVGTIRPGSSTQRLTTYAPGVTIVEHDVTDAEGFGRLVDETDASAVFNLASFSSVGRSWDDPDLVLRTNAAAVQHMLETLLRHRDRTSRDVRFFQASTAEMFGNAAEGPLGEDTPHRPRTPYAVAKSAAHHLVASYREHHGLFACSGVLFNHESAFRGQQFVAGRIAHAAARAAHGDRPTIRLGDLGVHRDWGAASDVVVAMDASLSHDEPGDYVIATGDTHTLDDLLRIAFEAAGIGSYEPYVELSPDLWSTTQAARLQGDPARAERVLGWRPTTPFEDLVRGMVRVELERASTGIVDSPAYLDLAEGQVR